MLSAIDHVGVAVPSIDEALAVYRDTLQMELVHRETVEDQGVHAALLDVGDSHIELIEPISPDTGVGRFLERNGPGMHHVAYRVASVDDALALELGFRTLLVTWRRLHDEPEDFARQLRAILAH